jgi:RimJ/RimL family protein N-acetyltransferase
VVSFTVPADQRSRALMERLGLRRDAAGDFSHPRLPAEHPLSRHVLYRLSRERWQQERRS